MSEAKKGDTVSVHYTGTLDDGQVFDSSREREPLTFVVGDGNVIPGFENAVEGMQVGDTREVVVESEDAYGERQEDRMIEVPMDKLPEGVEVGSALQTESMGQPIILTVAQIEDDKATLDGNHPLAGEKLHFEIELLSTE
jgi:peptidylprolyl isomerase